MSDYYPVADTCNAVYDKWTFDRTLDDDQRRLVDSVSKAVDSGVFYNVDVKRAVIADLGDWIRPSDIERQESETHRVEGGLLGYEIYYARNWGDKERNEAALSRWDIRPGRTYRRIVTQGSFVPNEYVKVLVTRIVCGFMEGQGKKARGRKLLALCIEGSAILEVA